MKGKAIAGEEFWFVHPFANCRNLGVTSAMAEPSFQLLANGVLIAI
jgi:hypothetical protein